MRATSLRYVRTIFTSTVASLTLIIGLVSVATPAEAQSCTTVNYVGCNSYVVSNILCRVNAKRAVNGRQPLYLDSALTTVATQNVILNRDTFIANRTPYVHSPASWYTPLNLISWGENVYWGEVWGSTSYWAPYTSSAAAVNWWWNSAPHKANILNGNFNRAGVACIRYNMPNGHVRFWYTMAFGQR